MLRPEIDTLKWVEKLKDSWKFKNTVEISFIFVPRRTFECDKFIQDKKLIGVDNF